jgi:hypothetical protein
MEIYIPHREGTVQSIFRLSLTRLPGLLQSDTGYCRPFGTVFRLRRLVQERRPDTLLRHSFRYHGVAPAKALLLAEIDTPIKRGKS